MKKRLLLLIPLLVSMPTSVRAERMPASPGSQLAAIERATENIRHLPRLRSVKVFFPSNAAFNSALTVELHRNDPDSEVALSQKELVLEGFLAPKDDYRRLIFQNLGAQVVGFYDPYRKQLYVRNDTNSVFGPARSTIAHEYTHALQDQHYHLLHLTPSLLNVKYRNSDALGAHHALIEGDAVNTQLLFIEKTFSTQDLNGLAKLQADAAKAPTLPRGLQRLFYNLPYVDGLNFAQKLYQLDGMRGVDSAYARLPSSTYEIMHPSAYLNHWKPVRVSLHAVHGFESWQIVDDDIFGAFEYEVLIWQYLSKSEADRITTAYRGDRYVTLEKDGQDAMLFQSVWTSHKAAAAARSALLAAARRRFPRAQIARGTGTTVVSPSEAVYLRVSGSHLIMVFAPTPALAAQLGTASTS